MRESCDHRDDNPILSFESTRVSQPIRIKQTGCALGLLLAMTGAWGQIGAVLPHKDGVYTFGEKLELAKRTHGTVAIPPNHSRLVGLERVCAFRAVAGADGVPGTIEMANHHASPYDEAVIEAVRHSQFEPGKLDRKPVPTRIIVWVPFVGGKQAPVPIEHPTTHSNVRPSIPLSAPTPQYTTEAFKRRISGMVAVHIVVTEEGLPSEARVVRSLGYGLDEKALDAMFWACPEPLAGASRGWRSIGDDAPGIMLDDAELGITQSRASKNHLFNRPPWAGVCSPLRITHIKNKGRLPRGVTQDFRKQASPQRRFLQRPFMVDHFHRFVAGAPGQAASGGQQMRPLPDSPCAQTVFPVIAVMHGKNADQGRTQHQARVSILWPSRCGPS